MESESGFTGQSIEGKSVIRRFLSRPAVFHGVLAGLVIAACKFSFYLFKHWEYNLSPIFLISSFGLLLFSVFMACTAERNLKKEQYAYFNAIGTGMLVLLVAILSGILAEQMMYRIIDHDLGAQMKQADLDLTLKSFENNKIFSEEQKQNILAEKQKLSAEDYYSFRAAAISFLNRMTGNGLFVLLLALFFRKKPVTAGNV